MSALISFEELRAMATAIARSGLFGVRDENQALALMLLAQAEGLHPMRAVQEYHIISGRPALRADAMLARFQHAGGRVEWHRLDNECVDATFTHSSAGSVRIKWTLEDAKRAGLLGKSGDNWNKYPRAMLRSRCIAEGIRTAFPGVVAGIYTPEEVAAFEQPAAAALPDANELAELEHTEPAELEHTELDVLKLSKPAEAGITAAQIKKIAVLLREIGMQNRDESRSFCGWLLSREASSLKDFTLAEASRLIEMLSNAELIESKIAEWIDIQQERHE